MTANVRVSEATKAELEKLKKSKGHRSVDAVIATLLGINGKQEDADGDDAASSSSSDEEQLAPRKQRKLNVRSALYSLDTVSERPGMIELLTGFDRATVDLLVRRFTEVSICCVFFSVSCCAPPKHPLPAELLYF